MPEEVYIIYHPGPPAPPLYLAHPMQFPWGMPKTITFKDTNYTRLRTKIHKWFETNWGKIRIVDMNYWVIETRGLRERTVQIVYEEK